ncbi:hypothetical protein IMZ11_43455, partial [Microtetraspora sp. AC03309]|uniref:hypothetical protein n=1 Tax=Microtetraspora sp. AC03309 TaxID=2779376 RepID=UPI001E453C08
MDPRYLRLKKFELLDSRPQQTQLSSEAVETLPWVARGLLNYQRRQHRGRIVEGSICDFTKQRSYR